MRSGATGLVVAWMPCRLKAGSATASTAAMRTGRYSGLHPAITALMAIFSTVAIPRRGSTSAITSSGARPDAVTMASTRSGVGGTTGSPSPQPRLSR